MTPDFTKTAFDFVTLCRLRFRPTTEGRQPVQYRSDYRCQLRYGHCIDPADDVEVRVYFVGQEAAESGDEVAVVLAFLNGDRERERCQIGSQFELRQGDTPTATGVVQVVSVRN